MELNILKSNGFRNAFFGEKIFQNVLARKDFSLLFGVLRQMGHFSLPKISNFLKISHCMNLVMLNYLSPKKPF